MLYKYPRTFHFSYSDGLQNDDKRIPDESVFNDMTVAVSVKYDGESSSAYPNHYHARSMMSGHHKSRDWFKKFHGEIKHQIPKDWRFCFENCFATHSISYSNLDTYAYLLNIWNENNECLSLEDTLYVCKDLELIHIPIICIMKYDAKDVKDIFHKIVKLGHEGIVVRNIDSFHYDDFSRNVGKCVRRGHIQTNQHWMFKEVVPNKLKKDESK